MKIAAQRREVLGTVIEIKLPTHHVSFFSDCFSELRRIEKTYSRFDDASELSVLNRKLNSWQPVSDEFLFLIEQGKAFNVKTNGHFDITLKKRLEDLGYDQHYSFTPKSSIVSTRKKTNDTEQTIDGTIKIDKENKKVLLRKEIEFGGFGKGFALDRVSKLLDQHGVEHYYINAGGDIFARKGANQELWTVLLEHPDDSTRMIGTVDLDGMAIASSAPNRRTWKEYHHLLNAKTKLPERSAKSVFVIAKTGIEADAYATALFTAGFEAAVQLVKTLPVAALIISQANKMYTTEDFRVTFLTSS